jgi:RES domain-containing protein
MPTLYLAEDVETAHAEANQLVGKAPPTVVLTIDIHLESVLDLTLPLVQQELGTDLDELCGPWRVLQSNGQPVPTHELGSAVFASGRYQAVRYPSVRLPGHTCFAVFTERLTPPDFVEVFDPHDNVRQRIP